MATRWETGDSVWLEDEKSGQFTLDSSRDLGAIDWRALAPNRIGDVAQLLAASVPRACGHGAIYPEGFVWCPRCGQALHSYAAQPPAALPAWWGASNAALPSAYSLPKHVPRGLPATALPLAAALETRPPEPQVGQAERKLPKPPNVPCVFAAANYGFACQRLLALAYRRGVLQYWDPVSAGWQVLSGDEQAADLDFIVSDYGWLPSTGQRRGEVALLPTRRGLVRLLINPVSETYATETVFEAPLASAPGAVLRHLACLFRDADGGLALWSARADTLDTANGAAAAIEARVWPCPAGAPTQDWSRPISYDDRLIWLHDAGHLTWTAGEAPQWLAWPRGWTPRQNFGGVVQSGDGRLWLIGHDGAYSFLELGKENAQLERIDGARLGFGKLLFKRGHPIRQDPWDSEAVEDRNHDGSLVLPLLQNVLPGRDAPTGLVLRFTPFTGMVEAALDGAPIGGRTLIEWIGLRNVILDEVIGMASPADCVPFVYDNHLWLHHPKWNEIKGWQLEALP